MPVAALGDVWANPRTNRRLRVRCLCWAGVVAHIGEAVAIGLRLLAAPVSGKVVVVGGGVAGLAAAARLAGDGAAPVLVERTPRLGGRAASFRLGAANETVDYGQHVLMRCCTAAQGFLQRIDASSSLHLQPELEIPVIHEGRTSALRSAPLPGILHLAPSLLAYAPLPRAERLSVVRAALPLLWGRPRADQAFAPWLRRHGQSQRAIDRLWNPICVAALNAPAESVGLLAARKVFREGFFTPGGADMGLFARPLSEIFAAARSYVEARGGTVRTSAGVRALITEGDRITGVELASGETVEADVVIAALPTDALIPLLAEVNALDLLAGAEKLNWSPIVNLHLWFDRPVMETDFLIPIDSPIQTLFDLNRIHESEDEGGRAFHVVISQSAAHEWMGQSPDQIADALLEALPAVLPAVREGVCLRRLVIKHPRATFVPSPDSRDLRPSSKTRIHGFYLAGDWVSTGWPSTIEGAVRSGVGAAARAQEILSPED